MDFDNLYSTYFQDVYRFIFRLSNDACLAEDITQETFIKAIKNINSFKGDCKISVWLCQIAKNTYFSYIRKHSVQQTASIEDIAEPQHEFDFTSRESLLELHRILHNLPEPYREVFTLKTFSDLSLSEISRLFGKSKSCLRTFKGLQ